MSTKTKSAPKLKPLNLALQGGGAYGAFTWGVLDQMLLDNRVTVEAVTATSAGAINAVVMAQGLISDGIDGARDLLKQFWKKVSLAQSLTPLGNNFMDKLMGQAGLEFSPTFMMADYMTRIFSPYQLNVFDVNPLRSIVEELVDFESIRKNKQVKLFINATNVRTGKIKVFETQELTLDMVMASVCLPYLFKTVEIDGEAYWDGGYSGNPALFPLFHTTSCQDILIVQTNPLYVEDIPTQASDILDRINEISFNSNLMREMRAIAFVSKLIEEGKLTYEDPYKNMRLHLIEAQDILRCMGRASKMNADWDFLLHLHDVGVQAANDWLDRDYGRIGKESTVDIRKVFL